MPYRLSDNVQARRESWGLLFYRPASHKVCFVRSADWLSPAHFDGTWSLDGIVADISGRTGVPAGVVERSLPRLTDRLIRSRMIVHEVR